MGCCGDTTYPERVEEICKIHEGKNDNKFVHLHLYAEPGWNKEDWEKAYTADPEE